MDCDISSGRMSEQKRSSQSSNMSIVDKSVSLMNYEAMEIEKSCDFHAKNKNKEFFRKSDSNNNDFLNQKNEKKTRFSNSSTSKIKHECVCFGKECVGDHCDCFLTPNQKCILGQCCVQCIERKNAFITTDGNSEQQNIADKQFYNFITQAPTKNLHYLQKQYIKRGGKPVLCCNCKKTKCQQKYCQCYWAGKPCQIYCECRQCQNKKTEIIKKQPRQIQSKKKKHSQIGDQIHSHIDVYESINKQEKDPPNQMEFQRFEFILRDAYC